MVDAALFGMNLELPDRVEKALQDRARARGVSAEHLAQEALIRFLEEDRDHGLNIPADQAVDEGMPGETAAQTVPHRDWHDKRHGHEAESPLKHGSQAQQPLKQHGDKVDQGSGQPQTRPGGRPQYRDEGLSRQSGEDFNPDKSPPRKEATGEDF